MLSRFDLIFLILDPQDEVYDTRLARHLVGLYYRGTAPSQQSSTDDETQAKKYGRKVCPSSAVLMDVDDETYDASMVNINLLKDYIAYAKVHFDDLFLS